MGQWSKTEPTLPEGGQWLQGKTIAGSANHWSISGTIHIASLSSTQFAVRMIMVSGNGSYGTYYPPSTWALQCNGETTTSFSVSKGTQTFYYVGEAPAGTEIRTYFLKGDSAISSKSVLQTVPTGAEIPQYWSKTAPTLPEGSNWEQTKTFSGSANHWSISGNASIARLEGNKFAIKAVLTSGNGSYGTYYPPSSWLLQCNIGGVSGSADTSYGVSSGTTTFYFISEAPEGTSITVIFNGTGGTGSAVATQSATFTAPALLGILNWININGSWKQANAVYHNVNGEWKQLKSYININNNWK